MFMKANLKKEKEMEEEFTITSAKISNYLIFMLKEWIL